MAEIPNTLYWQLSVNEAGTVVTDLNDIDQCIRTIVDTQKGSDPMRPHFGIDKFSFIDKPVNVMVPLLVKEITKQIDMWEQRATVKKIEYQVNGSQVIFNIHWISAVGSFNTTINA
jgi:phage baseplate assembly protein W